MTSPSFPLLLSAAGAGWVHIYRYAQPVLIGHTGVPRGERSRARVCSVAATPLPLLQGSRDVLGPTRAFRAALLPELRTGDAHVSFVGVFVCFFFFPGRSNSEAVFKVFSLSVPR